MFVDHLKAASEWRAGDLVVYSNDENLILLLLVQEKLRGKIASYLQMICMACKVYN